MKILSVHFSNLNSLYGSWKIDFEAKEFADNGIFVISGPTGSGKSTVLDAVTLALYGETPRLSNIGSGQNEIMSRLASDCFSEVMFRCAKGVYVARWSQYKARHKVDGNLQTVQRELFDQNGKILISGKNVPDKVAELTGLDFEKFTRSVILAQGGFSSFLNAKPSERSPILENISGTKIYSDLSQLAYNIHKKESQTLENLSKQLEGITPLNAEKVAQLNDDLLRIKQEITTGEKEIQKKTEALRWLNNLTELREEIQRIQKDEHELKVDIDRFELKRPALENALKALTLNPLYERVKAERDRFATKKKELSELDKSLPIIRDKARQSRLALDSVSEQLAKEENNYEAKAKLLSKVRELDLELTNIKHIQDDKQQQLDREKKKLDDLNESLQKNKISINENVAKSKSLTQKMIELSCDDDLVENLASYASQLNEVEDCQRRIDELINLQKDETKIIDSNNSLLTQIKEESGLLLKDQQKTKVEHSSKERELTKLLGKETEKSLQEDVDKLNQTISAIEQLGRETEKLANQELRIEDTKVAKDKLATAIKLATNSLDGLKQQLNDKKQLVELTFQKMEFQKRITDLEEERLKLENGKPCPLCGAIHHPYATNLNLDPKAESHFHKAQKEEEETRLAELEAEKNLASLQAQYQSTVDQLANMQKDTDDLRNLILENSGTSGINGLRGKKTSTWGNAFAQRLSILKNRRNDLTNKLEKISLTNEGIRQLQETLTQIQDRLHQQVLQQKSTEKDLEVHQTKLNDIKAQEISFRSKKDDTTRNLERAFQRYSLNSTTQLQLKNNFLILEKRKNTWQSYKETQNELKLEQSKLQADQGYLTEQITHKQENVRTFESENGELLAKVKLLMKDRFDLFGNQDTEQVALSAKNALASVQNEKNQQERINNERQKELFASEAQRKTLDEEVSGIQEKLIALESELNNEFKAKGFTSETTFTASRIPDAQRESLEQQSKSLSERTASVKARKQEKEAKLHRVLQLNLTTEGKVELEAQIADHKSKVAKDRTEEGRLTAVLARNEEDEARFRKKRMAYEKQKEIVDKWAVLQDLIGSSNGNKFRTFAQGLTFELLIELANKQLTNITPRYTLIPDKNEPLGLQLVDDYQDSAVRSTQNLSGGEAFLVSLSLALGMSQMTSGNAKIDSLFLDEGFGTLDENLLHTVLDALAKLHNQGKLIGVISHIQELKDSIPTRIDVIPQSSGRSTLEGPGIENK